MSVQIFIPKIVALQSPIEWQTVRLLFREDFQIKEGDYLVIDMTKGKTKIERETNGEDADNVSR